MLSILGYQQNMNKKITQGTTEGIYNPGHNILELYSVLLQVRFATSKTKLDISYNLVNESSHKLPNNLRLRVLGK